MLVQEIKKPKRLEWLELQVREEAESDTAEDLDKRKNLQSLVAYIEDLDFLLRWVGKH